MALASVSLGLARPCPFAGQTCVASGLGEETALDCMTADCRVLIGETLLACRACFLSNLSHIALYHSPACAAFYSYPRESTIDRCPPHYPPLSHA